MLKISKSGLSKSDEPMWFMAGLTPKEFGILDENYWPPLEFQFWYSEKKTLLFSNGIQNISNKDPKAE